MDPWQRRRVYLLGLLAFTVCSFLHGCTVIVQAILEPSPSAQEIVGRTTNPSGTIDAVVSTFNGGATVSLATRIHLVSRAGEPQGESVFTADHVEGLTLRWTGEHRLSVNIERARIFRQEPFRSIVLSGDWQATGVKVDVRVAHPEM